MTESAGAKTETEDKEEGRRTGYLDTIRFDLRRTGLCLRSRYEEDSEEFKLSLKYRGPDRYISAAKDLEFADGENDGKFEEDILPPFRSVFSQSNSRRSKDEPEIDDTDVLLGLFPGIKSMGLPKGAKIEVVNGFRPFEKYVKICKFRFGEGPEIKCGLSQWYYAESDTWPLISELAFDYEREEGDEFPLATVEGAHRLFTLLQRQPGWFSPGETTKTRFAYEAMAGVNG